MWVPEGAERPGWLRPGFIQVAPRFAPEEDSEGPGLGAERAAYRALTCSGKTGYCFLVACLSRDRVCGDEFM